MRKRFQDHRRKKSLLAKTIESIKELENGQIEDNDFDKLNQNLFRKTFNKNFNRNSSLNKIPSYKQKTVQTVKTNKENENYCKNIFIIILYS